MSAAMKNCTFGLLYQSRIAIWFFQKPVTGSAGTSESPTLALREAPGTALQRSFLDAPRSPALSAAACVRFSSLRALLDEAAPLAMAGMVLLSLLAVRSRTVRAAAAAATASVVLPRPQRGRSTRGWACLLVATQKVSAAPQVDAA
eukprot:1662282-Prymnesium_polylepis.2